MSEVGSWKLEVGSFLDILRTVELKFQYLKFQIPIPKLWDENSTTEVLSDH